MGDARQGAISLQAGEEARLVVLLLGCCVHAGLVCVTVGVSVMGALLWALGFKRQLLWRRTQSTIGARVAVITGAALGREVIVHDPIHLNQALIYLIMFKTFFLLAMKLRFLLEAQLSLL